MKPEPSEVARRGAPPSGRLRSKNSLKKSSNGEPGGSCGISGPGLPATSWVWVVEMLTTAGSSFSARSAKLSGAPRASAPAAANSEPANRVATISARPAGTRPPAPRRIGVARVVSRSFSIARCLHANGGRD